ncbi:hypothetical protein DSO57_1011853 [Entomophthora muscae]|uniref:Uncharacterized protein n=1 Tax=Entomophthora muscae TaxID=34485 RepID=A0ACC2S7W2_9FUNG|nr:hypothetical protein DSO57_1011853 [Entomophthora muscae]
MEPTITPKLMPALTTELPLDHSNKLFGLVYIALTGVIDTIVPAAVLWSCVCQSYGGIFPLCLQPAQTQKILGWLPKVGSLKEDCTLVNSNFVSKFNLTKIPLQTKSLALAEKHYIAVTQETVYFAVALENLHSTIQGPDIDFLKF